MSSSGASCFFTLFNLQGARPTSAAGTHSVYHTVLLLSSTFFKLFSERSAPKVQIQNSHPAAHRSRSELLYDIMSSSFCQEVFFIFFFRAVRLISRKLLASSRGVPRERLDNIPDKTRLVNSFSAFSFHFFQFSPLQQYLPTGQVFAHYI